MKSGELLRLLRRLGCYEIRRRGSHVIVRCEDCQTVVPVHPGEELRPGTLRAIERQLALCLGKGCLGR